MTWLTDYFIIHSIKCSCILQNLALGLAIHTSLTISQYRRLQDILVQAILRIFVIVCLPKFAQLKTPMLILQLHSLSPLRSDLLLPTYTLIRCDELSVVKDSNISSSDSFYTLCIVCSSLLNLNSFRCQIFFNCPVNKEVGSAVALAFIFSKAEVLQEVRSTHPPPLRSSLS